MATLDHILVPSQEAVTKLGAIASGLATAKIELGANQLFAVEADNPFHIKFGTASTADPTVADFLLPLGQVHVFDTGQAFTHIQFFSTGAGSTDFYVTPLSRF
jgi:hypothetical protein